ncbi:magnesium transporter MgtE, partial [Mycobacterium marinum]
QPAGPAPLSRLATSQRSASRCRPRSPVRSSRPRPS